MDPTARAPYIEFSGTVRTLHALRTDPNLLGSHTIPPTAKLTREIKASPADPDIHIHETASVDDAELFVFFYPWPRRDFDYLRGELRPADGSGSGSGSGSEAAGSYLDLVRVARANPAGFLNLEGVTALRLTDRMMAWHIKKGYFEERNPDKDRMFDEAAERHAASST
ncbi:hypothetical protein J3F83DRAFT_713472 [Trichoderma novae-zelandiae]